MSQESIVDTNWINDDFISNKENDFFQHDPECFVFF